ncbi:MAG: ribulose-phosphate 3-epimerase [Verrucomicrobia bacterium]|nr:ribulose-phosphate 3-epimerase [Verrucomicrobiota bacterium]
MRRPLIIAPSVLAADFGRLADEAAHAEAAGADWLHVDVMDGHFVPNLTVGPDVVRGLRRASKLPLDVHLMVERPDKFVTAFAEAGADRVRIHIESPCNVATTLEVIRAAGKPPGIVLNPGTPIKAIAPHLDRVKLVLVMTVNPGFGGQAFIESTLAKLSDLAALREARHLDFDIQVDGGVSEKTVGKCAAAGANVIVAGVALFRAPDMAAAIAAMRRACGSS